MKVTGAGGPFDAARARLAREAANDAGDLESAFMRALARASAADGEGTVATGDASRAAGGASAETGAASAPGTASGTDPEALAALREAAKEFEAYFLQYLLKGMRRTVPKGGLIDTGFAGDIYQEMYDERLAEEMAGAGGIGLADLLVEQLRSEATRDGRTD